LPATPKELLGQAGFRLTKDEAGVCSNASARSRHRAVPWSISHTEFAKCRRSQIG
jgi:hypothetical protein